MNVSFPYLKTKRYLVAVSGGPDSMALLDLLYHQGYTLIVAHVNYKKRKESDEEEALVRQYCFEKKIPFFVSYYKENEKKQSFQVKAREFRYRFFATIYQKEKCDGLFVAHYFDDLLETYLIKKTRNVVNDSYFIASQTKLWGMQVFRPLLSFEKKELLDYCLCHNLPFGIDKTNDQDCYLRNQIRHQLQVKDKQAIYKQALKDEKKLKETQKEVQEYLKAHTSYSVADLQAKEDLFLQIFLYQAVLEEFRPFINHHILSNLKNFLWSKKPNLKHKIKKDYYMIKAYQKIEFKTLSFIRPYCYTLYEANLIQTPYFQTAYEGEKLQGIALQTKDFPIQIRSYHPSDKIELKNGTKKISRLFIDKKVPLEKRILIPVVENKEGKILLVSGYYRYFSNNRTQNNYFVIEYKK